MAWSQPIPDDEIAAELAAALPEEERDRAWRGVATTRPRPRSSRRPTDLTTPAGLAVAADLARPISLAREQLLPVADPLHALLPWAGGLQRGVSVSVAAEAGAPGATSLALALAARASAEGSWVAVVGLGGLGLAAAAEAGLALDRLLVVATPPDDGWGPVVAALIGAVDLVLLPRARGLRPTTARRLAARARERGTVLVEVAGAADGSSRPGAPIGSSRSGPSVGSGGSAGGPAGRSAGGAGGGPAGGPAGTWRRPAFEAELELVVAAAEWEGVGTGHGFLRARRLVVEARGRRGAARPRRAALWLPGPDGRLALAEPATGAAGLQAAEQAAERPGPAGVPVVDEVQAARRARVRRLARRPVPVPADDRPEVVAERSVPDAG